MKKRILIFAVVASMLMTMLALPTFAEEVATEETTDEASVFSMVNDEKPAYESYYCFTLSADQAISYPKDVGSAGASVKTAYYMVATNGTYTSGKDAGDYDMSSSGSMLYLKGVGDYNQVLFGKGQSTGSDAFLLKFGGGKLTGIAGCYSGVNRGALYDTLYVEIGCGYWQDGVYVDTTEEVEAFVQELEKIGIDVKRVTYGGIVETIFDGFGAAIGGLAGGLKMSFNRIVYANGVGGAFSPLVIFIFVMGGLGLATGILYKIFGMVRRRKG